MPPELRVALVELKPEERGAGRSVERAKRLEGERLLAALPAGAELVALDERGRAVSTQKLSEMPAAWMRDPATPACAIAGADGLAEAGRHRAGTVVSVSGLTL